MILCGPRGARLTDGDRQALAEFEQFLRDRHAAEQSAQDQNDQTPRPENRS